MGDLLLLGRQFLLIQTSLGGRGHGCGRSLVSHGLPVGTVPISRTTFLIIFTVESQNLQLTSDLVFLDGVWNSLSLLSVLPYQQKIFRSNVFFFFYKAKFGGPKNWVYLRFCWPNYAAQLSLFLQIVQACTCAIFFVHLRIFIRKILVIISKSIAK